MKKYLLLCIITATTALTSCQKETSLDTYNPNDPGNTNGGNGNGSGTDSTGSNTGNNASLLGTWTFMGMQSKLVADVNASSQGSTIRYVTTTEYSTTNNGGTVTFTADKVTTKDMVYTAKAESKAKIYVSGMDPQEISFPFEYTAPASGGTSSYKAVSADSLYMSGGGLVSVNVPDNSGQNGSYVTQGAGYKYKISGTTLTLTLNTSITPTIPPVQGMTYIAKNTMNIVMTFKKQ